MSNLRLTPPAVWFLMWCLFPVALAKGATPEEAPPAPVLTNFLQVGSLSQNQARRALPVRVAAWVVAVDAASGTLDLRDATGGCVLRSAGSSGGATNFLVGQPVQVEATTRWTDAGPNMEISKLVVPGPRPQLAQFSPGERISTVPAMLWAEVEGTVTFAGVTGEEVVLEVSDRERRVLAHLVRSAWWDYSGLLHRRVRLRGVAQANLTAEGQPVFGSLWAGGPEAVHLGNPATQDWNSPPLASVASLQQIVSQTSASADGNTTEPSARPPSPGSLVRISGQVAEWNEGGMSVIADATGRMAVSLPEGQAARLGDRVEVLGILAKEEDQAVLYCGCLRPTDPANQLPLLTTVEQILRLKTDEARRGYPVRIRAVATGGMSYVQDETRGISVAGQYGKWLLGSSYEIQGRTGGGFFAPLIMPSRITYLGPGQLPEPMHPTWQQLANGGAACQWVELEGMVLSQVSSNLTLAIPGGHVQAVIRGVGAESRAELAGALVRVRGTGRSEYNPQRQLTGFWIDVPSPAFLSVEVPPPPDPFSVERLSVADILQFHTEAARMRTLRIAGQITYHSGQEGYLSDGTNGIKYFLRSGAALVPGDLVELVGMPEARRFSPVLREAVWRKSGRADLPPAQTRTLAELEGGRCNFTRVRVQGEVLVTSSDLAETVLTLLMESRTFAARIRLAPGAAQTVIRPGSTVELSGICANVASGNDSPAQASAFELLVPSDAEVTVLKQPTWWTANHLLQVSGALVAGLVLALGWVRLLHKQVAERTRQLHAQMQETERQERQHALEQERSRIARDLHDNLGSGLTEISMLAETAHYTVPAQLDLRNKFRQILDRSQVLVRSLDETVWAVDPAKDTLRSLVRYLAGFAEEFVASSGIRFRVEVPPDVPDIPLAADLRHDLFLAIKEALNNAVCHAQASEIRLEIQLLPGGAEIRIADDGRGFDPGVPGRGNGLANLRERMRGPLRRCDIESRPGAGTVILFAVTLPLSEAPPTA